MIIPFPKDRRVEALEKLLTQYQRDLDKRYDELNKMHTILNTLEHEASELERVYNTNLREYAKLLGVENVPVGFFEYSTDAIVYNTSRGYEIGYEKEEESP